jgi:RecA/RadA recombinase
MAKQKETNDDNDFQNLMEIAENDDAAIVDAGIAAGDVTGYISTGSYTLNALCSGSIYGGIPSNKVYAFAGEPSTGKTFYCINVVRQFLNDNPTGFVFYFESEAALSKQMMVDRGVNVKRTAIMPVSTVQEFRTQALKIVNKYLEISEASRKPMLFVLDSLGNLSTDKEMNDIAEGKDTRDMTRAQLVRGAFRTLTLKLGRANVALLVTNHVYDVIGSYVPVKKMGGGSGLEYAASGIIFLGKKKDKDKSDNSVTGAIISAVLKKSRLTIENKKVETLLNYDTGLDPYYGLVDLAVKFGIFKKVSTKIQLPDGTTEFETKIENDPETYFTEAVLDQIDEACKKEFLYGQTQYVWEEEGSNGKN